jgi:hypothetical protein
MVYYTFIEFYYRLLLKNLLHVNPINHINGAAVETCRLATKNENFLSKRLNSLIGNFYFSQIQVI